MKSLKNVFLTFIVAALFVNCSKENNDADLGNDCKKVSVKLTLPPTNRSIGDPVAVDYATPINEITLFFVDGEGSVVTTSGISTTEDITALTTTGKQINVSPNAVNVYAVANAGTAISAFGINSSLTDLKEIVFDMRDQQDISQAILVNTDAVENGKIIKTGDDATAIYATHIIIGAVLTRLEIASVKGIGAAPNAITAFNLKAVHINRYYASMTLDGAADGPIIPLITEGAKLRQASVLEWTYDLHTPTLTGATTYTPGENKVWNYMIPSIADADQLPRIVLELDNVSVAGTSSQLKYITVKRFEDTQKNPITKFEKNHVYRITTLEFSGKNLTDQPNMETIEVTATVTVLDWNITLIKPIL